MFHSGGVAWWLPKKILDYQAVKVETIVAVASVLKNLTVIGGIRKLMIRGKNAVTRIRVFLLASHSSKQTLNTV